MIDQINWMKDGKLVKNPFLREKDGRPIKLTFHAECLKEIAVEEADHLNALKELLDLPEIDSINSDSAEQPNIKVANYSNDSRYISLQLFKDNAISNTSICNPSQLFEQSLKIVDSKNIDDPKVKLIVDELILAEAHCKFKYDIFITMSKTLLSNRHKPFLLEANIRKPSEAVKIVGLFLRSRENYCFYASNKCKNQFNRGLFYWILGRHKLPAMWRYFSACVTSDSHRTDNILYLGQSILQRCVRALEALDNIGIQFYLTQNNDTRDRIMYHFDYLTLLLTGALDAQAKVAHRAYMINEINERNVNFRKKEYKKALRDAGAHDLHQLTTDSYFQNVMTILYEIRNTIHGTGFPTFAQGGSNHSEKSFVTVLPDYKNKLLDAANRCGGSEKWGFTKSYRVHLEPYTFAITLLNECLSLINKIADTTDVTKLIPMGNNKIDLMDGPPNDNYEFSKDTRKRLEILY